MEDKLCKKILEQQETIKGMQNNEDSLIKIMKQYENTKKELERQKQLYETDKESWKEQMYELQQRIDKAIEYNTYFKKCVDEQLRMGQDKCFILGAYLGAFHDTLEEILKGSDKE